MTSRDRPPPTDDSESLPRPGATRGDELVGRCLEGRFVLRERIGEDHAARLYRANHISLNRSVTIKVLHTRDAAMARRLHDQAFAVSRLSHPNIVDIYDYGHSKDGLLFIVTEHMQGQSLQELFDEPVSLSVAQIGELFCQLLDALEEAHAAGVIHGALDTSNIYVESLRDGSMRVKVADFGIQQLFQEPAAEATNSTEESSAPGSRAWPDPDSVAPELARGGQPHIASDVHAAGMVLHALLNTAPPPRATKGAATGAATGAAPEKDAAKAGSARLASKDPGEGAGSRKDDDAGSGGERPDGVPSAIRPERSGGVVGDEIRDALTTIAARATSEHPDARYPDAASFREDVRGALAELVTSTICAVCGSANEAAFRFCPECGAELPLSTRAHSDDPRLTRSLLEAKRVFAGGDPDKAIAIAHEAIGRAIRLGDRSAIISCYRTLGLLQAECGATRDAIKELEEALELVAAGSETQSVTEVPESLWQLQLQLARLYHAVDRHREALAMGSRALVSARQISSTNGRQSVQYFMTQLYAEVRDRGLRPLDKRPARARIDEGELFARERSLQPFLDERDTTPWLRFSPGDLDDSD